MPGQLIHKRKNYWVIRIHKRLDREGKQVYRTIKFEGDRSAARAELDRLLREQAEGREVTSPEITVNEYLDSWLETVAANRYSYKTLEGYKGIIAYDARPLIGDFKLSELQPNQVQRIFNAMTARGVCSNTQRRLFSVISRAFDAAVAWGWLEANPLSRLKMPRRKAKQVCALSKEETRTFLAVTDKGRHAEYFRLAVVTGMRPGEIGGLRWDDIDFQHCTVSVQRSLAWKTKSVDGWILVPTKTERGRREISIPQSLADALAGLKRRQEDVMSKTGGSYQNDGFVFANKWGRPVYPRQFVRHVFKVALVRAGLPRTIRLYDLRHTSATLLLRAGEHIKVVSERLGHSAVWITLEIYVHVLPGMQRDAANRMDNLLNSDTKHG
ncbi:MAG: tyrosine-type recombinase/integrase [Pyrinomonadaceae bacterium]